MAVQAGLPEGCCCFLTLIRNLNFCKSTRLACHAVNPLDHAAFAQTRHLPSGKADIALRERLHPLSGLTAKQRHQAYQPQPETDTRPTQNLNLSLCFGNSLESPHSTPVKS